MTVDTPVPGSPPQPGRPHRAQLAELLDRDVAELTDAARLVDDLALDSLAMMTVLVWLGDQGLSIDADRDRPDSVRRGVTEALLDEVGLTPYAVVLLPAGRLPRTSSGKLRRAERRRLYQCDDLVRK